MRDTSALPATLRTEVRPIDPHRLGPLIGAERLEALLQTATDVRRRLGARRIVNVNSTATGGGVAEMLATLLGYARGVGIEAEWLVIEGGPEFFEVTKRVHNGLYGSPGDGGQLGPRERAIYERTAVANIQAIRAEIRPGDVVIVHDPQPAGLIGPLIEHGASVVWRCHVGYDGMNEWTERAWAFIRPYVESAQGHVFSRELFAPTWIERSRMRAIPPSIDPFTPKNTELEPAEVEGLLGAAGLLAVDHQPTRPRVTRRAEIIREGGPPESNVPLVIQVSRWDRMKDMVGVLEGFVAHVDSPAHLVLAGPAVMGVSDDPEGEEVWDETCAAWSRLPLVARSRVDLAAIPMADPVENALVVNALQRHASVVVQKSLAEGFGLTVAEAMWKSRPVVASAVGGIVDQVLDGETGLLVQDPHDLAALGAAVQRLLDDPEEAARLARNARDHIAEHFLGDRHLLQYAELLTELLRAD
ncbi:MAG: glycosyltransferase [Gaiellaceae bacterium]|jgi:trehalose synthase|nr:glycosyltransferase [Gaiellaceae bacterium]